MNKKCVFIFCVLFFELQTGPSYIHEYNSLIDQETKFPSLQEFYTSFKELLNTVHMQLASLPAIVHQIFNPHHPYESIKAFMRFSQTNELCAEEKFFVQQRSKLIQAELETIFQTTLDPNRLPKIACCFSGGGCRSLFMTLGFLAGLEDCGLLNTILYCSSLSGSTWAIAGKVASGKPTRKFLHSLSNKFNIGMKPLIGSREIKHFIKNTMTKLVSGQIVSLIDVYGAILTKALLDGCIDNHIKSTLTSTHAPINSGIFPLPIYTAIETTGDANSWIEITPYEIGNLEFGVYIPTWSFGRKFRGCVSQTYDPELPLGYFLGLFGSAFAVSIRDAIALSLDNVNKLSINLPNPLKSSLNELFTLITNSSFGNIRLFPAIIDNFSLECFHGFSIHDRFLTMVDAGLDFNLPIAPLIHSNRNIDIIIIYDASATILDAPELQKAEQYARVHNLPFPEIDYTNIDKAPISVFKDDDPCVPVIIYMPRIKNERYSPTFDPEFCTKYDFCNTFNFVYKPDNIALLSGLPEFTLSEHQHVIKNVIKEILQKRYAYEL